MRSLEKDARTPNTYLPLFLSLTGPWANTVTVRKEVVTFTDTYPMPGSDIWTEWQRSGFRLLTGPGREVFRWIGRPSGGGAGYLGLDWEQDGTDGRNG